MKSNHYRVTTGFTIVELLVVIVVIAILAAITIVGYSGISQKANASSLQTDLNSGVKRLKMYNVEHSAFPATLDGSSCPTGPADGQYCLKASPGNTLAYSSNSGNRGFSLTATKGNLVYNVTEKTAPELVGVATLGTQTWMTSNINVGVMYDNNQSDNNSIQKWCYNNLESNCTTYGGLYQWDEMMQYVTTNGAQGICPAGFHIPTDAEWTTLGTYLGVDAGTALKVGGLTGMNMSLAGNAGVVATVLAFSNLNSNGFYWSSTVSGGNAWDRQLTTGTTLARFDNPRSSGHSIRCMKN